jgi:hypothetical protein
MQTDKTLKFHLHNQLINLEKTRPGLILQLSARSVYLNSYRTHCLLPPTGCDCIILQNKSNDSPRLQGMIILSYRTSPMIVPAYKARLYCPTEQDQWLLPPRVLVWHFSVRYILTSLHPRTFVLCLKRRSVTENVFLLSLNSLIAWTFDPNFFQIYFNPLTQFDPFLTVLEYSLIGEKFPRLPHCEQCTL